jgi:hypothetical protein
MNCERRKRYRNYLLLCAALLAMPNAALAEEQLNQEAYDWFRSNTRLLLSGELQDPAHSSQNPDNAFLQLPGYSATMELRPDLFADTTYFNWSFKPRVTAAATWWRDGAPAGGQDSEARFFVNEWMTQVKPLNELFISFGKEKLLWGASFLVSPSNILFKDTEKANPKSEVEGKYLSRIVYMPSNSITIIGISETRREQDASGRSLSPIRAVKADILGGSSQVSVIGYAQQNERFRFGSYGQWTASDAVVLYYDGIVSKGNDAFYPEPDSANPLGGGFTRRYEGSNRYFATVTAGGAYTFLSGESVSLELLYNAAGYDDADAESYYAFRRNASAQYFDDSALGGLSRLTLAGAMNTGTSFLRRWYLMAQVQKREIRNVLDVMLRYVRSLEERSGQVSAILEWQATKRLQVFSINTIAVGAQDTEFTSVLAKSFIAGIELHF